MFWSVLSGKCFVTEKRKRIRNKVKFCHIHDHSRPSSSFWVSTFCNEVNKIRLYIKWRSTNSKRGRRESALHLSWAFYTVFLLFRCLYVAHSYFLGKKWREAMSLYNHVVNLASSAITHFQEFNSLVQVCLYFLHCVLGYFDFVFQFVF